MTKLGLVIGTFTLHMSANPRKGRVIVKVMSQIHKEPLEHSIQLFLGTLYSTSNIAEVLYTEYSFLQSFIVLNFLATRLCMVMYG